MLDYHIIGTRIRRRRIQKAITQERMAEMTGISLSFYGHIERGTRKMSLETLCRIADALECSTDEILGSGHAGNKIASALELLTLAQQLAETINSNET